MASRSLSSLVPIAALALLLPSCGGDGASAPSSKEPWGANTVAPADLVEELAGADKPVIVCTAPPAWYRMGRIPGAVFHGPATSPAALKGLEQWAASLSRTTSLVIYCGCCPLEHCPNLRPAYSVLKGMGFERVRVLILPENFGIDWVNRGYPIER